MKTLPAPLLPARFGLNESGTPWSERYLDIYHSCDGATGQAKHVFLAGNGLPERWRGRERFVILEIGFGTGLNFLSTWAAWRADPERPRHLHFVSLEKHPFAADDLARLHAMWPEFRELASRLRQHWPTLVAGLHRLVLDDAGVVLTLGFGDAKDLAANLQLRFDALYLDGFAPDRNPEVWAPEFLRQLSRQASAGATVATWSVAAGVRQGLAQAGFRIEKRPGFGHKREMLCGRFEPPPWQRIRDALPATAGQALVIGAGLAGTACCERLVARGWQVTLVDQHAGPAQAASGNHAGIVMPLVSRDDNIASRLSRAAYLHALRHWHGLETSGVWSACGVLQLARDARHEAIQRRLVEEMGYPSEFVDFLPREHAEARLGHALPQGGWFFSQGGWAHPPGICAAFLRQAGDRVAARYGVSVATLTRTETGWRALDPRGELIAEAAVVILASGADAGRLALAHGLPLARVRGQVSLVRDSDLPAVPIGLCREGYLTPAWQGLHALGASYAIEDASLAIRVEDNLGNLARLERLLPGSGAALEPGRLAARVGFRAVAPDRLPLVGPLPDPQAAGDNRFTQLGQLPRHPGLHAALGYASRGLVWSSLMAELVVCQISGEPLPIENDLARALDPGRFLLRQYRRGTARDG
jgi:tRNA 5-methylaminomethyl-2-thiouridine biosynthesis bifunctional protein